MSTGEHFHGKISENFIQFNSSDPMQMKIWRCFIQILSYRRDLIDIIKPFMENLQNNNINKEKYLPFLKRISTYELAVLHQHGILKEENYQSLIHYNPWKYPEEKVEKIIQEDKLEELQKLVNEKRIKKVIITSFNEVNYMEIPIIQYCLIHKAMKCFKYLLINEIDDPTNIMEEYSSIIQILKIYSGTIFRDMNGIAWLQKYILEKLR